MFSLLTDLLLAKMNLMMATAGASSKFAKCHSYKYDFVAYKHFKNCQIIVKNYFDKN